MNLGKFIAVRSAIALARLAASLVPAGDLREGR
jgi:hypothetical protein